MASGRARCMYCEDNEGTDIDHFRPKATFPEEAFRWVNYLLACSRCNSNAKRNQFPIDGNGHPLLIDPTSEDPVQHLTLSLSTGVFVANTPNGTASITIFDLNRSVLQEGRRDAWIAMCLLLPAYDAAQSDGETERAISIERVVRGYPFSSVLRYLLASLTLPGVALVVPGNVVEAVRSRREIGRWA